jgi:hypothetical protein
VYGEHVHTRGRVLHDRHVPLRDGVDLLRSNDDHDRAARNCGTPLVEALRVERRLVLGEVYCGLSVVHR